MGHATFGKYVLLRKLATGGMGEVFLAKQVGPSGFEKLLVIKRILAHHHDKHEYLNMFLSEARLVAYLTHSNIIQIHEMGQIDGDYFIAMEYVRGKSLRDIIDSLRAQNVQLPLSYAVDLAIKLCDGLGYSHSARDIRGRPMNIIHRDINPHNVLISYNGDLKLIDFGIAKSEMTSVHTATGTIKGKFVYMSPEQSAADPIDQRSDIFSLGIVLYEMVVLENPFVRQNVVLSLEAIQRHPVAAPETKRPDAGPLARVLERALQKSPEDRYQSCEEMRDDLRNLLRTGQVTPPEKDLSVFLSELFSEDIEEEDRLLAEADQATTPAPDQIVMMPPSRPSASSADQETKAGRPPPSDTPNPITAAPFSDEEPTLAGDPDSFAARSRRHSGIGGEPTGQVMTLIPPEDIAPGTGEEFGVDLDEEPNTRKDRVPSNAPAAASLLPPPEATADMPLPRPPSLSSDMPAPVGAFQEPLTPSRAPLEATKELPLGRRRAVPDTPVSMRTPTPSGRLRALDPPRDPSVSLPAYAGPWRRSMVIAAALVFLLTAVAGYWVTRSLTNRNGAQRGISRAVPATEPLRRATEPAVVPAPDPTPVEGVAEAKAPAPEPAKPKVTAGKDDATALTTSRAERRRLKRERRKAAREAARQRKEARAEKRREERAAKLAALAARARAASAAIAEDEGAAKPKKRRRRRKKAPKATPPPAPAADGAASEPDEKTEPAPKTPRQAPAPKTSPKPAPDASPAPAPKPEKKKAAPKPEEAEPERTQPASGRLGILTLRASVGMTVEHRGRAAGSAPSSLIVRKDAGKIVLTGDEFAYSVEVTYRVQDDGLVVSIESSPWAIVKHNGISLGKTPQGPVPAGRKHRFSLLRPGQSKPFVVSLVWNRSAQ